MGLSRTVMPAGVFYRSHRSYKELDKFLNAAWPGLRKDFYGEQNILQAKVSKTTTYTLFQNHCHPSDRYAGPKIPARH